MERTYINEVQKEIGSTVKVQGFIENLRNSKYPLADGYQQ